MALSGTVTSAPVASHGFDTDSKLHASDARNLRQAGFAFCLRYLSRGNGQSPHDLTGDEASTILGAGLALMAVQHVAMRGWHPSAGLGTTNGKNAAQNAASIGLPTGINLWLDLEGVAQETTSQQVIDHCNAWFTEVDNAGFVSGLYVGPESVLNGHDLFFRLRTKHYWKSASRVPDVENRGYQMMQSLPHTVAGVSIDADVTKNDAFGGAVIWLAP